MLRQTTKSLWFSTVFSEWKYLSKLQAKDDLYLEMSGAEPGIPWMQVRLVYHWGNAVCVLGFPFFTRWKRGRWQIFSGYCFAFLLKSLMFLGKTGVLGTHLKSHCPDYLSCDPVKAQSRWLESCKQVKPHTLCSKRQIYSTRTDWVFNQSDWNQEKCSFQITNLNQLSNFLKNRFPIHSDWLR